MDRQTDRRQTDKGGTQGTRTLALSLGSEWELLEPHYTDFVRCVLAAESAK